MHPLQAIDAGSLRSIAKPVPKSKDDEQNMGFFKFFSDNRKSMIGVDISSSAVKLIELSRSTAGYKVEAYGIVPLAPQTVVEKNIIDINALVETIEEAITLSGATDTDTTVAVSDSSVLTKEIELPAGLTDLQMETQIEFEADQHIPYPIEEIFFDFYVLGSVEGNQNWVRVLLAACRRDTVEIRRRALTMAGLTAKVINIESDALELGCALLCNQSADSATQVSAIVDIGNTMTSFSVLASGKIGYTQDQMFGGQLIIHEIQRRYGMSYQKASDISRKGPLPEGYEGDVIRPFKALLLQNIVRSLQLFYSSSQSCPVDRLFLTGGVSALKDLAAEVERTLHMPTEVANPLSKLQISPSVNQSSLIHDAPAMMLAIGLALGGLD